MLHRLSLLKLDQDSGAVLGVEEHDRLAVGPDPGLGREAADLLRLQISAK